MRVHLSQRDGVPFYACLCMSQRLARTFIGSSMHESNAFVGNEYSSINFLCGSADQKAHEECFGCPGKNLITTLVGFELPEANSGSHKISTPFVYSDHVIRSVSTRHFINLLECINLHHVVKSSTCAFFNFASRNVPNAQCPARQFANRNDLCDDVVSIVLIVSCFSCSLSVRLCIPSYPSCPVSCVSEASPASNSSFSMRFPWSSM